MKLTWALISLFFVVAAVAEDEELTLADNCDAQACQLPDCRCSSTDTPGGLEARDTPQFVLVTFDDAVNIINIETYRDTLYGRTNSNGCNVGATWYVSHEYTNYQLVNELYNNGFEIALHSITHQTPPTYWAEATRETIEREFADQRVQMSHFANIPADTLQGIRMPFLQLSGNASFEVMKNIGMTYDCSWPTINTIDPGLWPYTLDYASTQDCPIPPCPTASLPGQWVIPMISWRDLNDGPCSMADGCYSTPSFTDEDAWYEFIIGNFERHYLGNRAPFGFYVHEWYLRANPAVYRAFVRFLDTVNELPDAFMVNSKDVIDWVKDPVPVDEYKAKACQTHTTTTCAPTSCGPLSSTHTEEQFWMGICTQCPRVYPWIDNPLGQ